jgi:hypothetical protein
MTKDEALTLALEALTYIYTETTADEDELIDKAITAIKAALAEQDAESHLQAVADFGQLQEPVAWVGLTRMELIKCGILPWGMSYKLYEAIEAKLKEKNT